MIKLTNFWQKEFPPAGIIEVLKRLASDNVDVEPVTLSCLMIANADCAMLCVEYSYL